MLSAPMMMWLFATLLIATNGRNGNCTDGGGGGVMNRPGVPHDRNSGRTEENFYFIIFRFWLSSWLSCTVWKRCVGHATCFFVSVRRDLFSASFYFLPLFLHKFQSSGRHFCCRHVHLRETVVSATVGRMACHLIGIAMTTLHVRQKTFSCARSFLKNGLSSEVNLTKTAAFDQREAKRLQVSTSSIE